MIIKGRVGCKHDRHLFALVSQYNGSRDERMVQILTTFRSAFLY